MTSDLRAPAIALGAWVGAAAGWLYPHLPAVVVAIVGISVSLAVCRPGVRAVAVVMLCAAAVAAVGSAARQLPPEIDDRTVRLTAVVTGPPRQIDVGMARPPAVSIPVSIGSLDATGRRWTLQLPARLFADAHVLSADLTPGTTITCLARIESPGPRETWATARLSGDPELLPPTSAWDDVGQRVREGVTLATRWGSDDASSLVAGISLGDESSQSPELAASMQTAGLSHLTAVSGGNFMIVLGAVVIGARVLRRSIPTQVAVAAVALVAYAALVGPQPSVLRAATMAAAGLIGILSGGASRGIAVLSGAVTVLMLASPELAWSLGFALSVVATGALQVVAPRVGRVLGRWLPRSVALAFAVTVTAQVATAPLLIGIGAPVSWVAVPANLLVGPAIAAITLTGVLAAVLGAIVGDLGAVLGTPAALLASYVVVVAEWAQRLSMSSAGDLVGRALMVGLLAATVIVLLPRWGSPQLRLPLAAGICAVSVLALRVDAPTPDWRLIVCDVGQGTAVVVRTSVGPVLLDAGPADGDVPGCLARAGIDDLAAVVVSHFHVDHVAGLLEVFVGRRTHALLAPSGAAPSGTRTAVEGLAAGSGLDMTEVGAGQRWQWGEVNATALWPPTGGRSPVDDANNGSLVVLLEWPDGFRVLVPGDIEPESQSAIMRTWDLGALDVAVIPHHGSDHQDPRFAGWAQPGVAVASAGTGNSYGHPAVATLSEYEATGALVRRTDQDGSVVVSVAEGQVVVAGS